MIRQAKKREGERERDSNRVIVHAIRITSSITQFGCIKFVAQLKDMAHAACSASIQKVFVLKARHQNTGVNFLL